MKRLKKNTKLAASIVGFIILLIIISIVLYKTYAVGDLLLLDDVTVENIEFNNTQIENKDDMYIFSSTLKNKGENKEIKYIVVNLKDKDDKVINLNGYIGNLSKDETKELIIYSDQDLTKTKSLSYQLK